MSNAVKNFNILATNLNILHNYFDNLKIIQNYFSNLAKILDFSAKSFFPCKKS